MEQSLKESIRMTNKRIFVRNLNRNARHRLIRKEKIKIINISV